MGSILFVHGTGVRQEQYEKTFAVLDGYQKTYTELKDFRFINCLWGDIHGARLLKQGDSIPGYAGIATEQPQEDILKWWLLYQDPFFALKELLDKSDANPPPRKYHEWESKKAEIAAYVPSEKFAGRLREHGLDALWKQAQHEITQTVEWKKIAPHENTSNQDFFPAFCAATAEAIMAQMALQALSTGIPTPTAQIRREILRHFSEDLQANVRGIPEWFAGLGKRIKGLVLTGFEAAIIAGGVAAEYSASQVKRSFARSLITDNSLATMGDILFYQARGERIRDLIEGKIQKAEPPVFLLAHSLGGIACVDLLIERKALRPLVKGLITAGSQAPLLYEMDCLVSRSQKAEPGKEPLLEEFPPWLNFYDPNDYLSYAAEEVFKAEGIIIKDEVINSYQPHLMAHSAYWKDPKFWKKTVAFIQDQQGC